MKLIPQLLYGVYLGLNNVLQVHELWLEVFTIIGLMTIRHLLSFYRFCIGYTRIHIHVQHSATQFTRLKTQNTIVVFNIKGMSSIYIYTSNENMHFHIQVVQVKIQWNIMQMDYNMLGAWWFEYIIVFQNMELL